MTKFIKDQFIRSNGYVTYCLDPMPCAWDRREFVARFKYAPAAAGSFITFLIKNFTVEEYFGRLNAGETPLKILESKGYMLPHIKKLLTKAGYPVNQQGFQDYIKDGTHFAPRNSANKDALLTVMT